MSDTATQHRLPRPSGPRVVALRPRRPQLGRRVAIAAAAAAVLTTGVGVLTAGGGSGQPAATPTAATSSTAGSGTAAPPMTLAARELNLAAVNTLKSGDPVVGPGRYTRVVTDSWRGQHVYGITFLDKQRLEVWVPADDKGTWYWRETGRLGARFFSAADQRYMRTHHPDEFTPTVFVASGHNGRMENVGPGEPKIYRTTTKPDWDFPTPAWLATQPRDPQALLSAIEAAQPTPAPGTKPKADTPTLAFFQIAHTLSRGFVPADLRAALYRAAIRIPGIELVSSTANIDGRKGIAIGRLEPYGFLRQEIIFDSAGGQFLGAREIVVHSNAEVAHLPVGATYTSTAVTVSVTGNPHLL
jgi:RNA polymerase sigma-70 factor (ECF subfamily)